MAQYQRFLSYLFEYEGDEKKENCGFAKVEVRGEVQRIFLSVRSREPVELLHVFGFYRTEAGLGCVPLGRLVVKGGRGQLQYVNSGTYLPGSSIRFDQLAGLVIGRQQPFSNAYATVWDDAYFGLSLFETENSESAEEPDSSAPKEDDAAQSSGGEQETQEAQNPQTGEDRTDEEPCKISMEEKPIDGHAVSVQDTEEEGPVDEREQLKAQEVVADEEVECCGAERIWNQLSVSYPHIETLPSDTVVCLKVMPADIGRLPRQNWMLSNNGFLMYSFVKHRYIVFARVGDDHYELWVPGNYDRNEEFMAQMFGFYRFRSAKSREARSGDFGYWCVPLAFPAEA